MYNTQLLLIRISFTRKTKRKAKIIPTLQLNASCGRPIGRKSPEVIIITLYLTCYLLHRTLYLIQWYVPRQYS